MQGTLLTAPPQPPTPGEAGWKDTARCYAGAATRIAVRFESYAGRNVWHCHLLEPSDNQMMRPLVILPV
ncbi:MAG: multicopper oxidase domain-containing protein [Terriglobales bacterium]